MAAILHAFNVYIMSDREVKNLCCLSSLYSKAIETQCFRSIVEYFPKLLECYFRRFPVYICLLDMVNNICSTFVD